MSNQFATFKEYAFYNAPPPVVVNRYLEGYQVSRIIQVSAKLEIDKHLTEEYISVRCLSEHFQANIDILYRLLRALASLGLIDEDKNKGFRKNNYTSSIELANSVMFGDESYQIWGEFEKQIFKGQSIFCERYKDNIFTYLSKHLSKQKSWVAWNNKTAESWFLTLSQKLQINGSKVIDIAGGNGILLRLLATHHPDKELVLFDLHSIISNIPCSKNDDNIKLLSGDMFEHVPEGYDTYILCRVLFNWSKSDVSKILHNIRAAMNSNSILIIIENLIPDMDDPYYPMFCVNDLNLLSMFNSGHHTYSEMLEISELSSFVVESCEEFMNPCGTKWHALYLSKK